MNSDENIESSTKEVVYISSDLEPLIGKFLANRKKDTLLLQENIQAKNLEEIRKLGHTMKGNGASYGFPKISEWGKMIEDSAKANELEPITPIVQHLALYLDNVEVVFVEE
jgi:HPt (histidine-containing phosphotransfer) domain-containing protein